MANRSRRKFSAFLREARTAAGLTQEEVARHFGYSTYHFVSNWERGVSNPPGKIIRPLAELYGITAERLYRALVDDTLHRMKEEMDREFYGKAPRKGAGG